MSPHEAEELEPGARRSKRSIRLSLKARQAEDDDYHPSGSTIPAAARRISQQEEEVAAMAKSKSSRRSTPARSIQHDGPFSPARYYIYFWPVPRPRDFTNLSDSQRHWKREADEEEEAADVDTGIDDWYDHSAHTTERIIAHTFKTRAKRAFWAGKTWAEFVLSEKEAYSEVEAKKFSDDYLSAELRWEVWAELKRRLCEEIWSQPYADPPKIVMRPRSSIGSRHNTPWMEASGSRAGTMDPRTEGSPSHIDEERDRVEPMDEQEDDNKRGQGEERPVRRKRQKRKDNAADDSLLKLETLSFDTSDEDCGAGAGVIDHRPDE